MQACYHTGSTGLHGQMHKPTGKSFCKFTSEMLENNNFITFMRCIYLELLIVTGVFGDILGCDLVSVRKSQHLQLSFQEELFFSTHLLYNEG